MTSASFRKFLFARVFGLWEVASMKDTKMGDKP